MLIKTQFSASLKAIQTDWGGEFRVFTNYLNERGIIPCPHTSHQNGIVERKHRQIVEMGLTLLAQSHLPHKFWDHSFTASIYLINKLPTSHSPKYTSPFHALFNKILDYKILKTFGCACFPFLRPYNKHKMDFRSQECIYLGVSPHHKGHKCLAANGKIYISKDVLFNECRFPYATIFPTSSSSSQSISTFPSHIPLASTSPLSNSVPPSTSPCNSVPSNNHDSSDLSLSTDSPHASSSLHESPSSPSSSTSHSISHVDPLISSTAPPSTVIPSCSQPPSTSLNVHPMVTRSKNWESKAQSLIDF